MPGLSRVEAWIKSAKSLERAIEYQKQKLPMLLHHRKFLLDQRLNSRNPTVAKAHTKNTARIAIMTIPKRGPASSEIADGEDCTNDGDCVNAGSLGAI